MIEIVSGPDVARYVGIQCNVAFAEPFTAIGFKVDGKFEGGAVFNGYDGHNVDLSVANSIKRWPPAFVRFFGDYIWTQMNVQRVTMIVRPNNSRMCVKMGAKLEGVLRKWYPDGSDAALFGLLKDEWKLDR